jgi:hypothetical protein
MLRTDVPIAFVAPDGEPSELEIRINFGVFAGREATPAELDELGRAVMAEVEHVTLVSEHRRELECDSETSLHQVRMDIPEAALPVDTAEAEWTRDRILRLAERWTQSCFDARHAEVIELFPDEPRRR